MEKSDNMEKLAAALAKFQGELEQPALNSEVEVKTTTGGKYKFKYADLSECKRVAKRPLADNGLSVAQLVEDDYSVRTILLHDSGQWISSKVRMPCNAANAQSIGSAITYAKRYAFCALLGIVADNDEDGNLACGNEAKPSKPSPIPPKPEKGKRMFDPKVADNPEFFPKIYAVESETRSKGGRFSLKAFLENVYMIDVHAFDAVAERYADYKINNNLN